MSKSKGKVRVVGFSMHLTLPYLPYIGKGKVGLGCGLHEVLVKSR